MRLILSALVLLMLSGCSDGNNKEALVKKFIEGCSGDISAQLSFNVLGLASFSVTCSEIGEKE